MNFWEKRAIWKEVERELRADYRRIHEREERKGEERLTDYERTQMMGIVMRLALYWGAIVGFLSLFLAGYILVSGQWQKYSWWILSSGPVFAVGYFLWKRNQYLDRAASIWKLSLKKAIDAEVERRISGLEQDRESEASPRPLSAIELVNLYGAVLERETEDMNDSEHLPAPKEAIKKALLAEIAAEELEPRREALKVAYVLLGSFQDGVNHYGKFTFQDGMTAEEIANVVRAGPPMRMRDASLAETQRLMDELKAFEALQALDQRGEVRLKIKPI